MRLDYTEHSTVKIDMTEYIRKKCLHDLPKEMEGHATTPACDNLYIVDNDSPKLNKDDSDFFHSKVATLLFLAMRGRPDLLTAISFLCTRIKSTTKEDNAKLG